MPTNMTEQYISYLKVLGDNTVIKSTTNLSSNGELRILLGKEKEDHLSNFIRVMLKKGYFVTEEYFLRRKITNEEYISFYINWDLLFERFDSLKETAIYRLKSSYPKTYEIMIKKGIYFAALDFVKFHQPGQVINTYDQLLLLELRQLTFNHDKEKMIDLFCNLHVLLEQIPPVEDESVFSVASYKTILKEVYDIELPVFFEAEVSSCLDKTREKLYTLAKEIAEERKKVSKGDSN